MRLYLSSYVFGNHPEVFIGMARDNKRIAFIPNADALLGEEEINKKNAEYKETFRTMGLEMEAIDLHVYAGKQDELREKMKTFGLVWVKGGNTFVLKRSMDESGFTQIIKDMIINDEIVFGGSSAGIIITTPSLCGSEFVDDPISVPEGYPAEVSWEGLSIVPYHLIPHAGSDFFPKDLFDMTIKYYEDNNLPYKTLKDGEAIVINGTTEEIVS